MRIVVSVVALDSIVFGEFGEAASECGVVVEHLGHVLSDIGTGGNTDSGVFGVADLRGLR